MGFILSLIGVVLIVEGLPYLAFPQKTKDWARLMGEASARSLRLLGIFVVLLGLALLFAARNFRIYTG